MPDRETVREVRFDELEGADLTGKILECKVIRYGIEQVLVTDKAVSVIRADSNPTTYRILFPEEYEKCHNQTCYHLVANEKCFPDPFQEYVFASHTTVMVKEVIQEEKEEVQINENTKSSSDDFRRYGMIDRETSRILPQLFAKMIGNGGLSIDTDSMSLADPRDRHHLEWLARITAGFVIAEQEIWEPQIHELTQAVATHQERTGDLERLLDRLREASSKEDVTIEQLQELIGKYRNPLENHYDKIRQQREKNALLDSWAAEIMSKPAPEIDKADSSKE